MGSGAWSQDSGTLPPQSSGTASAWGGGGASQAPSPAPPPMPAGPPQIMRRGGGVKPDEFPTLGAAAAAGPAPAAGADGGRASWDVDDRAPQGAP